MKEIPILFSTPMIKAIMDGKKTMTRRVIKKEVELTYPRYEVGNLLWVRETFNLTDSKCIYKADYLEPEYNRAFKWKPSIFMPRAASRITLKVTDVKIQRLQEITEGDAKAEGIICLGKWTCPDIKHITGYKYLWNELNLKRGYGWDKNPLIYAITFERVK